MKKIKDLFYTFVCVTTCVVFAASVFITLLNPSIIFGVELLWQILIVSFLCSIGIFIYPEREVSKKTMLWLIILHYIEVNAVVLGSGILFEWFHVGNLMQVIGMLIMIAVIFVVVSVVCFRRAGQLANRMNEQLRKMQEESRL